MAIDVRKDILWRIYLVYLFILVLAGLIIFRVAKIQFSEGEYWKQRAKELTLRYANIEAVRGNIFDVNGQLLATSLPYYDVAVDINSDAISDEIFEENIDSLAYSLSSLFQDRNSSEYRRLLTRARVSGDRYLTLKNNVSYKELKQLKTFPIFRKGRYKGGLIYTQKGKRELPFRILAARTIGYSTGNSQPVGLEGSFNDQLNGVGGKRLVRKIAGGVEMPVNDENEVEPQDGCDIVTTIDINIQDVAENALYEQLKKHQAAWGTVVLMEVATGEIRAIANLTRVDSANYAEKYNYAIGQSTEPGSTFKLASLMAAMEDGFIGLEDTVNTGNGRWKFRSQEVKDSHEGGFGKLSVLQVFEKSSNVGTARLIQKYYGQDPQRFIDRIYKMGLNLEPQLDIAGAGKPRIKSTHSKEWSAYSLPWMAYGYELTMTPLQVLTFYNAVANNGKMMKPAFVREVRKQGKTLKVFNPEVIHANIASPATISKARTMLEGVVKEGTATNLKNADYQIAGKTGTAQIAKGRGGYGQQSKSVTYQASFVGYFPANDPKYSIIVVVNAPSEGVYYGNAVAGPIFREISDKVYSTLLEIHEEVSALNPDRAPAPLIKGGLRTDVQTLSKSLALPVHVPATASSYIRTERQADSTLLVKDQDLNAQLAAGRIPDLNGMGLKDALYVLENAGLIVKVKGSGAVRRQSVPAGTGFRKGDVIELELN